MLNYCKTSRKSINLEDIWEPDSPFTTAPDHTLLPSDEFVGII